MKSLALLVAVVIMIAGLVGLVAPDRLMTAARFVLTPAGLYAIAALRVGVGTVLMLVAPISRTPRTLRVLGVVVVIAGLATPLFGVERALAIADWGAARGAMMLRGVAGLIVAVGGVLAFVVATGRRAA